MHRGHDCGVALIGAADRADAPVGFGHMLHQPIYRVVGIGGIVNLGGIERPWSGRVMT